MKKMILMSCLFSISALAQAPQTDYGHLSRLPGGNQFFSISPKKTLATDYSLLSKLQVNVTDLREEFKWEVPKSGEKQTLVVEREGNHRKVRRVTRTGRIPGKKDGEDAVVSSYITPGGDIQSHTVCGQKFKKILVGLATSKTDEFRCSTWNKKSCDYVQKVLKDGALAQKINQCNDLLRTLSQYQNGLKELTADDHQRDMKAIASINGKKDYKNAFEMTTDSLGNVSMVYENYLAGAEICDELTNHPNASFEKESVPKAVPVYNSRSTQQ
jgi:hypothetical protein